MEIKPRDTVLLTDASGGLGAFMARAFADRKVRRVLAKAVFATVSAAQPKKL
jgi:NADP-dependent 3-hydroxy acid dehydrogenase YdfG